MSIADLIEEELGTSRRVRSANQRSVRVRHAGGGAPVRSASVSAGAPQVYVPGRGGVADGLQAGRADRVRRVAPPLEPAHEGCTVEWVHGGGPGREGELYRALMEASGDGNPYETGEMDEYILPEGASRFRGASSAWDSCPYERPGSPLEEEVGRHHKWIKLLALGSVLGLALKVPWAYDQFSSHFQATEAHSVFEEVSSDHPRLENVFLVKDGGCTLYIDGRGEYGCSASGIVPGVSHVQSRGGGSFSTYEGGAVSGYWPSLKASETVVVGMP